MTPKPEAAASEQRVKAIYPKAFYYRTSRKYYRVMSEVQGQVLGEGKLVAGAWDDAASKLPEPQQPITVAEVQQHVAENFGVAGEVKLFTLQHRHSDYHPSYYRLTSPSGISVNLGTCEESTDAFIAEANAALRELQRLIEAFNAVLSGKPLEDGTWPHMLHCNGDRRQPAGTPNITCCCHPRDPKAESELRRVREENVVLRDSYPDVVIELQRVREELKVTNNLLISKCSEVKELYAEAELRRREGEAITDLERIQKSYSGGSQSTERTAPSAGMTEEK